MNLKKNRPLLKRVVSEQKIKRAGALFGLIWKRIYDFFFAFNIETIFFICKPFFKLELL